MFIDHKKGFVFAPPPEFWGAIYCERGVRYGAWKCKYG